MYFDREYFSVLLQYTLCWELAPWEVVVVYIKYQLLWCFEMMFITVKIQLLRLISFI